jgi:beta-glucoside operon transcriptional antiterminator
MLRVKQRLNNNVVLVEDNHSKHSAMIVMGKGIGYRAYPGNPIDEHLVERTFILKDDGKDELAKIATLIEEIPMEYIILSDTLLKMAEKELKMEFGLPMLISLADHIFSAVDRKRKQIQMINPLAWDIKLLYPVEAKLGEKAVEILNEKLDVALDEAEATAIAMHFISNSKDYDSTHQAMQFTKVIADVISIIQYHFQFKIDQESISFSRFVTHIQYFLLRQVKGINMMTVSDEMIRIVINQYPTSFQCAEKIIKYLNESQKIKCSLEEEIYLTMHIERIRQVEEQA